MVEEVEEVDVVKKEARKKRGRKRRSREERESLSPFPSFLASLSLSLSPLRQGLSLPSTSQPRSRAHDLVPCEPYRGEEGVRE